MLASWCLIHSHSQKHEYLEQEVFLNQETLSKLAQYREEGLDLVNHQLKVGQKCYEAFIFSAVI